MAERNRSIDIFRYICAIMVVAIHTSPFSDIDDRLGYLFTEIIPRIAVPFFFVVSGYFYTKGLGAKKKIFLPYIKRLLKTYTLWSLVYFAIDFVQWGHQNIKGFIVNCIYSFFVIGSHYHFWFFPAMFFVVCATTIVYKFGLQKLLLPVSIALYAIGCLGCSYYSLGTRIPVLSLLFSSQYFTLIRRIVLMAFPFFAAGYLVDAIEKYVRKYKVSNGIIVITLLGAISCWLLEIYLVVHYHLQDNIVITFCLYILTVMVMVFLLRFPMPQAHTISQKCQILANFTYHAHPLTIILLTYVANMIGDITIHGTAMFFLTVLSTWAVGLCCIYYRKTH